jgi:serine/threonine protein kinase/tetratricopeptide (TPR) repeat protein
MVGQTLGHYRIVEQIGVGGMGVVYRAHDERLDRDIALKLLTGDSLGDLAAQERLHKEALALSKLNHPNIAHIYDFDIEHGVAFLIMEYVRGTTLAKKLADGPLPEETVVSLGVQVTSALEDAAEVGVVHRDIKPSNIMLTLKNEVKVLDFGLAKLFRANENELTQSRTDLPEAAGTLPYMAPEQLKGDPADFRSDIYSLGSVLYEAATGRRPFASTTSAALIAQIISKTPELPHEFNANLSSGLENTIMRCLAKEPARRYQRASELRIALESIKGSHVVVPTSVATTKLNARRVLSISTVLIAMIVASIAIWRTPSRPMAVDAIRPNELAVLPVNAADSNSSTSAFDNGLVETLTSRLTQLTANHPLQVVPASEIRAKGVTSLQEARQQFGVTLGLEITIERSGQMVRVNYALVDAKNHKQLRGDTITASNSDPFALEDRVADSLVKSLEIELRPQEQRTLATRGTNQPVAYDYYLQGRGYLQEFQKSENIENAIVEFKRALQEDPRYGLAFAGLGEAYWRRYELDKKSTWVRQAEMACQQAINLDSNQSASHSCLGMVYNGTGQYQESVSQYERAVELEPTDDNAIRGLASAYERLGRFQDAEKTYQAAIRARPQYWRSYNALGALYVNQARYAEATKLFAQVIALAPDSFRGYSNLGATYIQLGRYDEAVATLQRSISIRPTVDAFSNLGTAFYRLRRFDEAAVNYSDASKLDDQDYVVWGNLADAYYYSGRNRSEALAAYEKAISLAKARLEVNPRDQFILGDIASYYSMLGHRQEALSYMKQALQESAAKNPLLLFQAAMLHNQLGETDVALELLARSQAAGYSATTIAGAPALDNLHSDPRFQHLLAGRLRQQ